MSTESNVSWMARSLHLAKVAPKYLWHRYRKIRPWGKVAIWCTVAFYVALGALFIKVTPARIFQQWYDLAQRLSHLRFGWLALGAIVVFVSFPPLTGHTTAVTLCGFAYGMKGFAVAAIGSSIGSALVFLIFRFLFSTRVRHWSSENKQWQALESVVRDKGLPLVILIRMSPIPTWMWSNVLFSSIEAVALWQFIIATLFVYPKILLHVFIGSRTAALSDGEQRSHMDTQTKVLNGVLIGSGVFIVLLSSWLTYRLVQKQLRRLEGFPEEIDRLATEDIDESAPLLKDFSDESVDEVPTAGPSSPQLP